MNLEKLSFFMKMADYRRENLIQIVTEIEKALSDGSYEAFKRFEHYLSTTSLSESKKIVISSALRDNLNRSLAFVLKIFESKVQERVFKDEVYFEDYSEDRHEDEESLEKLKELEKQIRDEKEKKSILLNEIEVGKNHLNELKTYLKILNSEESTQIEENLLRALNP